MSSIDWSQPPIIAALIGGAVTICVTVVTLIFKCSKANKEQSSILSRDVTQIKAERDVNIGAERAKKASKKK